MPSVLPAPPRRILFSASASALPQGPSDSSCVSSPMAKYSSCSLAHGPQKATPRISSSARRGQGLAVLLRTWHATGIGALLNKPPSYEVRRLLDRLFEGAARAEGG